MWNNEYQPSILDGWYFFEKSVDFYISDISIILSNEERSKDMGKKIGKIFLVIVGIILFLQFCNYEIKSDSLKKEFTQFIDSYQEETFHEE